MQSGSQRSHRRRPWRRRGCSSSIRQFARPRCSSFQRWVPGRRRVPVADVHTRGAEDRRESCRQEVGRQQVRSPHATRIGRLVFGWSKFPDRQAVSLQDAGSPAGVPQLARLRTGQTTPSCDPLRSRTVRDDIGWQQVVGTFAGLVGTLAFLVVWIRLARSPSYAAKSVEWAKHFGISEAAAHRNLRVTHYVGMVAIGAIAVLWASSFVGCVVTGVVSAVGYHRSPALRRLTPCPRRLPRRMVRSGDGEGWRDRLRRAVRSIVRPALVRGTGHASMGSSCGDGRCHGLGDPLWRDVRS